MDVNLFTHDAPLGIEIKSALSSGKYSNFKMAVAYTRASGVSRIYDELDSFTSRGGKTSIITGIDQQHTSYQALVNIKTFAKNNLFIHYDTNFDITFHPKLYAFGNKEIEKVFIGSSNLTAGGLFLNFEANLEVKLDATTEAKQLRLQIDDYWQGLLRDGNTKVADLNFLDELLAKGAVADETKKPNFKEIIAKITKLPFKPRTKPSLPKASSMAVATSVPVSTTFAMTLSNFDVSAASSDPVILIPLKALRSQSMFWYFPKYYTLSGAGFPELRTIANVTVNGKTHTNVSIRIYYYDGKKEFRLSCELIKRNGSAGDIVTVRRNAMTPLVFDIELHRQSTSSHIMTLPKLTEKLPSPSQKRYAYF